MIPLSFGDIALLNHLLEERGTRYQVRWKDCFTACLEPPGECCFTPELQLSLIHILAQGAVALQPGLGGDGEPGVLQAFLHGGVVAHIHVAGAGAALDGLPGAAAIESYLDVYKRQA